MMYSGMLSPQFVLAETATLEQSNKMADLASEAKDSWLREGHPGWSVTQADSDDFMNRLQQVQVTYKSTMAFDTRSSQHFVHDAHHVLNVSKHQSACGFHGGHVGRQPGFWFLHETSHTGHMGTPTA